MWCELDLSMTFTTPLCGGVPRSDRVVADWIATRTATDAQHERLKKDQGVRAKLGTDAQNAAAVQTLKEIEAERLLTIDPLPESADEAMSKVWVGFSRDELGLFVRGGSIRAHLKACATVVGRSLKEGEMNGHPKVLNFRAKAIERLYIRDDIVHLRRGKDGAIVTEATDSRDATLTVMTAQGPRTCLKRIDHVHPCTLQATIQLFPSKDITRESLKLLLEYGRVQGFNQDRSLQFGRYEYTLGE